MDLNEAKHLLYMEERRQYTSQVLFNEVLKPVEIWKEDFIGASSLEVEKPTTEREMVVLWNGS